MSERAEDIQNRPTNKGVEEDVRGRGGEGDRAARTSPTIGKPSKPGQTSHTAPEDDVGVPPDEGLAHEEAKAQAEGQERHG
jgi:hypothetical protein